MKRFWICLLLLVWPLTALAGDAAIPADPALVSVLMPEYELTEGIISREGDELRLLMRRPDGMLVFVGGVHDAEDGWQMTESTPLPEGTSIGMDNFVYSLVIGDLLVDVAHRDCGAWGISAIYPMDAGSFRLGPNWIESPWQHLSGLQVGDHPWNDLTTLDWSNLPGNFEEAVQQLDTTHWSTPTNPNPADRLNLRAQPDKKSASLGKYYNGAPVRVLEVQGDWARVDVLGTQGWMMLEFLGLSGFPIESNAFPQLMTKENGATLYAEPAEDAVIAENFMSDGMYDMKVIGVVNEEYYHVWFYLEGTGGYIRTEDLWPGNG